MSDRRWAMVLSVALVVACNEEVGSRDAGKDGPRPSAVGDLDGDGALEIVVQSFDHGLDLFRVPGSGTKCMPWSTGRGNLLRNGQGPAYRP